MADARDRAPARARLSRKAPVVLGTLVAALAVFACSAATWVSATVRTTLEPITVDVAGSDAAPAVTALGLVAAAGALATAISGRALRPVVAVVVALAGLGALAAAASVLADPSGAAQTVVGETTGMVNAGGDYALTAWPWLAAAAAGLVALCGLWALVAGRTWTAARRYERPAAEAAGGGARTGDEIDSWDALTEGRDPTA
ncbi:Trp biosynthesis-associated membrane protein [Kocuria sp.]|uniref:Trp biosynthesis-associated membrane protein n=1 Tax=Kocuria sp. TaxID=1871328 RepID=UPI0028115FF1|nr:Trp biosynthesis-associated membrane protein [Kocuria sp.]